jgi:hypothetical protein
MKRLEVWIRLSKQTIRHGTLPEIKRFAELQGQRIKIIANAGSRWATILTLMVAHELFSRKRKEIRVLP